MIHYQHAKLLSAQLSLSDSTKSTMSTKACNTTKRSNKRRRVSFNRDVLVCEDDSYSQEERNQMHYTRDEMRSFAGAILQYIESIRCVESQSSITDSSSPFTATGLEGFLHPEHKKKHRLQGVLSVLMEQERQYKEQGLFTPVDFDSMSHSYHMASQESQEEAHQRALTQHTVVSMAA
ncbi:unnamed protein product [Cylindrotheca closterium]|uniref:Uncharacterized protein n=1 Tax=Cylindrotheca closterium TaxID=2856 RepID=A0AAD2CU05_9STRA|nr:unnamed protein product [Cylindrotheca closterium]